MYYTSQYDSPLGPITLVCDDINLIGLWMERHKHFSNSTTELCEKNEHVILIQAKSWLNRYFNKEYPKIKELPLSPKGSTFRQEVWQILCDIPYGEVTTYKEIADLIAKKRNIPRMSAQAVGGAVGHNPISIIIPCHRVVGMKGNLVGFGGGIEKKIKLLEHEGLDMTKFFVPTKGTAL